MNHRNDVLIRENNSPSAEIESYMIEGYDIKSTGAMNKSYRYHEEEILNINYGLYDADCNECDSDRSNENNDNDNDLDCEML